MTTPAPGPALHDLAERLHVDVGSIAHLERLGATALGELEVLLARVQSRDEQEIEDGFQKTLRFVPRLLRGRVEKLLFPEGDR